MAGVNSTLYIMGRRVFPPSLFDCSPEASITRARAELAAKAREESSTDYERRRGPYAVRSRGVEGQGRRGLETNA